MANLVVVRVVSGGDLQRAGSELDVHIIVTDYGNRAAVREGHHAPLADERLEPVISRVHRHRGISEDGLRAGGGDGQVRRVPLAPFHGVLEVVQRAGLVAVLHLEVGDGGLQLGRPVDHVRPLVDETALVKGDESLEHSLAQALVQGETLAGPVARSAEPPDLVTDAPAVLLLPLPGPSLEFLSAHALARQPIRLERPLHHQLRRDAGVVGAREPQRGTVAHARVARHDVLKRDEHRVSHVQRSGDVGRGHGDREGLARGGVGRLEVPVLLPHLVQALLDVALLEVLGEVRVVGARVDLGRDRRRHRSAWHEPRGLMMIAAVRLRAGRAEAPEVGRGADDGRDGRGSRAGARADDRIGRGAREPRAGERRGGRGGSQPGEDRHGWTLSILWSVEGCCEEVALPGSPEVALRACRGSARRTSRRV